MNTQDLGKISYGAALEVQEQLFGAVLEGDMDSSAILFCEHKHVYTLGRSGDMANMLINEQMLERVGAEFFKTNRGGDITYHGPGQIVVYPILNLGQFALSLRGYIELLEQCVIDTIAKWGVIGERMVGATGVWIEGNRKICALGVKASRNATMHGLALNVTTDLKYFDYINPCGFTDKQVTSLSKEIGYVGDENELYAEVKLRLEEALLSALADRMID